MRAKSAGRAQGNPTGVNATRRATAAERAETVERPGPYDAPSPRLVSRQITVWCGLALAFLGLVILVNLDRPWNLAIGLPLWSLGLIVAWCSDRGFRRARR